MRLQTRGQHALQLAKLSSFAKPSWPLIKGPLCVMARPLLGLHHAYVWAVKYCICLLSDIQMVTYQLHTTGTLSGMEKYGDLEKCRTVP